MRFEASQASVIDSLILIHWKEQQYYRIYQWLSNHFFFLSSSAALS